MIAALREQAGQTESQQGFWLPCQKHPQIESFSVCTRRVARNNAAHFTASQSGGAHMQTSSMVEQWTYNPTDLGSNPRYATKNPLPHSRGRFSDLNEREGLGRQLLQDIPDAEASGSQEPSPVYFFPLFRPRGGNSRKPRTAANPVCKGGTAAMGKPLCPGNCGDSGEFPAYVIMVPGRHFLLMNAPSSQPAGSKPAGLERGGFFLCAA